MSSRNLFLRTYTNNKVIRNNQLRFVLSKSCLSKLMSSQDKMMGFLDRKKAVAMIHLNFSKAFNNLP